MNCTTSDGLELYYETFGNTESGEAIIFLNGLTQSTMAWAFVTPAFKQKYKIILMDFVFQGQSTKNASWRDFDKHAADVRSVLDKENTASVHMVGISYGSLVAQHFAVLFPTYLKKLVLISTFAHKTPYYDAVELAWWRALEIGGYNLMLDIMLPSVLSENYFANPIIPISAMKAARQELNHDKDAIFNLMRATKERKDYRNELEKISVPTLIIQGEKDLLLPVHLAQEVQKHIKKSKLIIVKNAGHTLNLENVAEVCKYMLEFLK